MQQILDIFDKAGDDEEGVSLAILRLDHSHKKMLI